MLFLFLFYSFLIFIISFYLKKKNYFSNYTGDNHQMFTNDKNIPLVGGISLIIPALLVNPHNYTLSLFLILIFSIGFFSDKKILISPKLRFLFQLIIVALSIFLLKLEISSSRLIFFDNLLENSSFNLLFTAFKRFFYAQKIMIMIHYQAIKIFFKKGKFNFKNKRIKNNYSFS